MQNLNDKLREMKKITILFSMILLAFSMSLISCNNDLGELDNPTADVNTPKKDPNFKSIIVMSDIHVMAPQLLENRGTAYENYLSQDPKLLEYSGEVLEYLVGESLRRNPDLVIIPGDLTKDGELVSHQLVVSILGRLRSADIPVIVVPGNHDIDNPEGYYFDGDNTRPADRTSTEQFKTLYADFGYNQAYAKGPASLSFVCEPLEGLVLLCIDTNKYENNLYLERGDAKNNNQTSGRIRPATLTWMLAEADKARTLGKQVVLKRICSATIYTMNCPNEEFYRQMNYHILMDTSAQQLGVFGPTEILCSYDTYQFSNYDRYDAATFSEAHKAEVRDTQFPQDLEKAYELGKRLIEQALRG